MKKLYFSKCILLVRWTLYGGSEKISGFKTTMLQLKENMKEKMISNYFHDVL